MLETLDRSAREKIGAIASEQSLYIVIVAFATITLSAGRTHPWIEKPVDFTGQGLFLSFSANRHHLNPVSQKVSVQFYHQKYPSHNCKPSLLRNSL